MNIGSIIPGAAVDGEVVVFGRHKKEQVTKEEHDGQDYKIKELQDYFQFSAESLGGRLSGKKSPSGASHR